MGLCLLGENSFITMATWFLKTCSTVGKWEISPLPPQKKRCKFAMVLTKYLSWIPGSSHLGSTIWRYSTNVGRRRKIALSDQRVSSSWSVLSGPPAPSRTWNPQHMLSVWGKHRSQKLCWLVRGSKTKTRRRRQPAAKNCVSVMY